MSQAVAGVGTVLYAGDAATGSTFTPIEGVINIGGPEISVESIDVTSLDSVGRYKQFIPGLRDGGALSFSLNWRKSATQTNVRDRLSTKVRRQYRIEFNGGTRCTFLAIVESFTLNVEASSAVTADFGLKISGDLTWGDVPVFGTMEADFGSGLVIMEADFGSGLATMESYF